MSRMTEIAETALAEIAAQGLTKRERAITSPQSAHIQVASEAGETLNLCANNYLGLADDPRLIEAAKRALDEHGFGMASVRFICGTSDLHLALEKRLAAFKATQDAILYSSCFDANAGLFETLLGPEDVIHLRQPQPRLDHRRRPALQGQASALRQQRHGRSGGEAAGGGRRARGADRHRRRVLHGRDRGEPVRDLRSGGTLRRRGDGG